MSWPPISEFSKLLGNASVAFSDSRLRKSVVEKNSLGQPFARSGQFASVFKAVYDDGSAIAVKAFNRRAAERRERYEQISAHLSQHRISCLVDFEYQPKGIRSAGDGKMYPLVVMEWVEGTNLFDWMRQKCRLHDAPAIRRLSEEWRKTVSELRRIHVAHGDLQHGNIIVASDGAIKLVDYDCMSVPTLEGREAMELGLPPYQHPTRNKSTELNLHLSRFSSILIYAALKVLAFNPKWWAEYVETSDYDKLLFRREDLEHPDASRLIQSLRTCGDGSVREVVEQLLAAWAAPYSSTPELPPIPRERGELYQSWLGVFVEHGSPDCHELLGLSRDEGDPEVIRAAADRRLSQVVLNVCDETRTVAQELVREINSAQQELLESRRRSFVPPGEPISSSDFCNGFSTPATPDWRCGESAEQADWRHEPDEFEVAPSNETRCSFCGMTFAVPLTQQADEVRCPSCRRVVRMLETEP